ncbi:MULTISPECIES: 6-phosphogluconolactonase [Gordonia]|uniref:6-phosphogluconolactonase n=1 Tax=Gordonia alkanivorans CGMCC 6845 TaxID=1423140 RepID=W9DIQ1_9ACTN|nr:MULTISPECIES: 6-phosphogluconolactonase [Gordonia]ETA06406.1 6-phosphogluconolactonase [Gordonia alkanivorans CGMCC 6845]MDH3006603.1 6-phosphogluconolactonase [Gordonia alkanivorans]MDH3009917.1 6-phosphogluconolactonase [Gordonia alkanivorans]MDH3014361.1 6-phosphogluconolactonase [Gordonia alkanivorans]MDH3018535.1 6-phosphogluconolactonase [Gordonia alkanivorans]
MANETLVFESKQELVVTAAARFIDLVTRAQAERDVASIVLTGGSNGIGILSALAADSGTIDWSRVDLYWGDDRFVPADDPERNSGQAREALLDKVPVDPSRVFPMAPSDGPFGDDIDAAAADYAAILAGRSSDGIAPEFDLHLLGMGGEGHINSLFPHTAATAETEKSVVAVEDSPKPPPRRITLTLPVVNRSRNVWFLVAGADKAEAVVAAHNGADPADWPCAGAHGTEETIWFLDEDAASRLK